jgi:hypothetical protein
VDWLDPKTWEASAALAEHWQKIAVAGVAILGAAGSLVRWGLAPFRWAWSKIRTKRAVATTNRPLRFVSDEPRCMWTEEFDPLRDCRVTHVGGYWHVSNVSSRNVFLLKVRLKGYEASFSAAATRDPKGTTFRKKHPLLPEGMSEVVASFQFLTPIRTGNRPLVADVIFTDNYGDEHVVTSVRFRRVYI